MSLVIVESPTKAKTINKYLGQGYKVISSFGHIRDLPSKDGSVLPDEDFKMLYQVSPKSSKHVKEIVDEAKKTDEILLASDPDREGESIAWHIAEILHQKKAIKKDTKVKRIVFHEITKNSVSAAIQSAREIDMNLVNAQQARRALDYLVGFTLSPVLWHKLPGSKSAGRVQSVALRLICEREDEIERFKSQEYWSIDCELATQKNQKFIARLSHVNGQKLDKLDLKNEDQTQDIVKDLEKGSYQVLDVEKKTQNRYPAPPFITSTLQQEASRKLGFTAKKTMMVAQKLYEGINLGGETVGLITYMRTDGTQLSTESLAASRKYIKEKFGDAYLPEKERVYKTKAKNAQEAHEAIRPTNVEYDPSYVKQYLDHDQFRLYELIWKRMVACQMGNAIFDQVLAKINHNSGKYELRASGSTLKFDGFLKLYREGLDDKEEEKENMLPPLTKSDDLSIVNVLPEQHFTQPPPRYSEASLVKKLEELGIGRPSTYASIISVLQDRNYVKIDQKRFFPEERGIVVTAFLKSFFAKYVEYDFTADLEDQLDKVSDGKFTWKDLLKHFWKDFKTAIDAMKDKSIPDVLEQIEPMLEYHIFEQNGESENSRKCPACEKGRLGLKMGRFGPFVACSNYPECHFTRELEEDAETAKENMEANEKAIYHDDVTNKNVYVKHGPYGHYLQMGEDGEKDIKRSPIPKFINFEELDEATARKLMSLPRVLGNHPETGEEVSVNIGKFGPYILHNKKFTSIKNQLEVFTISLEEAVKVIADSGNKSLGKHNKQNVEICKGRYGFYIKYGKQNVRIPKGVDHQDIDLEKAKEIIEQSEKK